MILFQHIFNKYSLIKIILANFSQNPSTNHRQHQPYLILSSQKSSTSTRVNKLFDLETLGNSHESKDINDVYKKHELIFYYFRRFLKTNFLHIMIIVKNVEISGVGDMYIHPPGSANANLIMVLYS